MIIDITGVCGALIQYSYGQYTRMKISYHPNKASDKQLIHVLQYDCDIGYLEPQFTHSAGNLAV